MTLFASLTARQASALEKAGIATPRELLYNFPFRYEDRRNTKPISGIMPDEWVSVLGTVLAKKNRRGFRKRLGIFECLITDGIGNLHVIWFNQPWLDKSIEKGNKYYFFGRVSLFSSRSGLRLQLDNPEVEPFSEEGGEPVHTNRIVPVYGKLGTFGTRSLRTIIHKTLKNDKISEILPEAILEKEKFAGIEESFRAVHFPENEEEMRDIVNGTSPAVRRFRFEELFAFEVMVISESKNRKDERAEPIAKESKIGDSLRTVLPFELTSAQKRAFRELVDDASSAKPMYRLLQGDVGSGKTIIAFLGMIWAALSGFQAAYMAPTETLANQVFLRLSEMAGRLNLEVKILLSSTRAAQKRKILKDLGTGGLKLVVGTQSLFQEGVNYNNLNLIVIDEQHRFGVRQRAALAGKGLNPHLLVMTATPIPRSLALTLYGDLDLSVIDEMPPVRAKVTTAVRSESAREKVEEFVRKNMDQKKQAIYVFPQVEGNEAIEVQAASAAFEQFRLGPFRGYPVALLHGKMASSEKDRVMELMRKGEILLLVATTVVEVGIDLPSANVIVVENAERFGLAQLHQLRGRVGRGGEKGFCILMMGSRASQLASERLRIMVETDDGFKIAEEDLRLRGAGELAGTRQWGPSQFRFANPARDLRLLEKARVWAQATFEDELFKSEEERDNFRKWEKEFGKKFQFMPHSG
jgi:ATP-dependent DNA helicase RecG